MYQKQRKLCRGVRAVAVRGGGCAFRIAAVLYQRNKKYAVAIELSKKDAQLQDCIDTAKESGSSQLVEDLLK